MTLDPMVRYQARMREETPICVELAQQYFGVDDPVDVARGMGIEIRQQRTKIARAFAIIKYNLREVGISE
jgi:hypothetical protein